MSSSSLFSSRLPNNSKRLECLDLPVGLFVKSWRSTRIGSPDRGCRVPMAADLDTLKPSAWLSFFEAFLRYLTPLREVLVELEQRECSKRPTTGWSHLLADLLLCPIARSSDGHLFHPFPLFQGETCCPFFPLPFTTCVPFPPVVWSPPLPLPLKILLGHCAARWLKSPHVQHAHFCWQMDRFCVRTRHMRCTDPKRVRNRCP